MLLMAGARSVNTVVLLLSVASNVLPEGIVREVSEGPGELDPDDGSVKLILLKSDLFKISVLPDRDAFAIGTGRVRVIGVVVPFWPMVIVLFAGEKIAEFK
jgi:hypothetical protein